MTSTNDGKDVNCKQSSGPKGKLYFIELYKFLDSRLSGEEGLQERTQHVCQAWQSIHSLCLQSSPKLHLHLLGWLQTHTAQTILHTEWQKPELLPQHGNLAEAIDVHINECKDAIATRKGSGLFWEIHLLKRAEWFKKVLSNPWGHPILKRLSNPTEEKPSDKEVIEWLKEERSEMFVSRLRQLAMSKACDKEKSDKSEPTFADILSREAGFNSDVWDLLTDMEFVLLFQGDNASRCIELAKQRSLRSGYKLVERLLGRADKLPRDKKLWKNAKKVAKLIAQVTITRCMVLPSCAGVVYDALYHCARSLAALLPAAALPRAASALAAPAATAAHLHTLAAAVSDKCKDEMKAFVCELYVRAITTGMNELERLKLKTEKASEARSTEQMLCTWFTQLGSLLSKSPRLNYECALTAFSVHPSPAMYERIVAAPALPPLITNIDTQPREDTNSEFGSWATDSRTTTNFVKTSETLNIKQIQNNANVLSTAVLTEGEAIGLGTDLCQDLAVLLSGPRHKILSWDINRDVLLENCKTYMERTDGGTRALTTELKYLNLDPRSFQHLPFEKDDEDNIYYGIEKGYEHLVEHEEVEVEKQWHEVLFDSETEDAISSCMDDTDSPVRRKKKKSKRLVSTDEEVDPLSLSDDQQHQKKKERPHSKERLKSKAKSSKNKDSTEKKERKERKKKDKINTGTEPSVPLSSLIGMKVTRVENASVKQEKQNDEQNLNRKLSITSLNSDNSDNNVVFDGLYSMDDIYSPDKSHRSLQALTNKTIKSNADLDDDNKPLSQVVNERSLNNKNKEKELRINSVITSQQQSAVPDNGSSVNTNYKDFPPQQDNTVKQNLKKLIEVRRFKSESNTQVNNTSQLQSSDNGLHTQSHSIVYPPQTLQEDSKDPCSVPLIESSSSHQSMNNVNLKQFDHISPSTSEVRSILNGNSGASDTSGKLYVGRIVFGLAKYTSSLNEQKLKESDAQSKPKAAPVPKVENKNNKIHSKRPPDKEKRIAQKQVLVRNQPQHDKPKNINEIKTEYNNSGNKNDKPNIKSETITSYNNLVNELQPQQADKVKNTNETKSIYKNLINELQPQQRCDKLKSTTETKNNYKNFVDELKATINAGAVDDEFYKESVTQKDRAEPSSKTFSMPNQNKLKIHSASTPQCAKSVIHQKITEAPNTFARLNYMHKNKQSHSRNKPTSGIKQIQEKILASELDKQISDYKLDKFHYLQTKDLTISRVGTGIHNGQPNDTPIVIQKREVRAPLVLQKRNTPNMIKDQSGISKVIKPNENKIPLKIKTEASDGTTKSSMLMEKDQQDLLLLLRQQNKLNAQNPVITTPEVKFNHVAQISPQCKTESRSLSHNVISNTRDLNGADFRRLTDYDNKNILHENSSNKTLILPSDQTHPSVIKMTSGSKAIINSSQLSRKSEGLGSGPGSMNDVYSGSKMPVKKERYTQKKNSEIHLDIETKSDWKLVMQDLLKHKTPSRGPNALDVALNKDSFTKHTTKNTICNEKAVGLEAVKRNQKTLENSTSLGNTGYQSVIPSDYTLRTAVTSVPMATIQPEVLKRISKPEVMLKTDMYYVPKPSLPEVPKITCDALNNHDPFISGLPNSDYDILEELMDDDLRQEIGELISDDESLQYANVTDKKEGQCSTIVTPFQKSFYDNTQRAARTQEMQSICTTALKQDHSFATTNIARNVINTNLEQFPQSSVSVSAINSGDRTYSNIKVAETTKITHPNNIVHNIEFPGMKGHTISSNISHVVESRNSLHTPRSNNGVYQKRENNLDSRNLLFTTISPRASIQNVGIGLETAYNPYYTMPVQENENTQVHNFDPNKFITINNMPNISFLPTTTFAAPLITPVVFGDALTQAGTQNNVQKTLPTSTIHPMKYSGEPNLNSANQSNKFIETPSRDSKNKITPKNEINFPDVKLENNKHLILNNDKKEVKERKALPQELVGVKLPHTKPDHKLFPTVKPLENIDTKILCSMQSKRLEQKRMALINRETRHYTNRSPIPLPYTSLEKGEIESVKANKYKNSDLNVKYVYDDIIPLSEKISILHHSKNESLEKCKNDKDIRNVAESTDPENERKNKCSDILHHNSLKPTTNPIEKHETILNESPKVISKKDKLKTQNSPLKVTSTLKRKISKAKTLIKPAKIRGCNASINLNNCQDNSIEATRLQKLEENTEIRGNLEINGKIINKYDSDPSINTFSIENESFDIEEQLIGSVISKSILTESTKHLDIFETKDMTVDINGRGEEKENDLNKSQNVINEKQDTNNIEADETSIKNNCSEQKSNTDIASTKICNGKSVLRRLKKKRIAYKNPSDEIKTFKTLTGNESSKNKLSIKSPLANNDVLHENRNETKVLSTDNNSSIKQKEQTVSDEVIDLDEVPETSVPQIELTNNLVPVNNNDKLANCRLQCYRAFNKKNALKKRCQKIYTGKMDLKQIIFQEVSPKTTKNKGSKAIHVILPNGIKFRAIIKGNKNCDINNLVIDTSLKCSLLNNFFNNKITFSRKVRQKKSIGFSTTTKKSLENTNVIETIDLISDEEIDSGVTPPTEIGDFSISSLDKDLAKHQTKLSSKCTVSLNRYSIEELIALKRSIKDTKSCGIEKSIECLAPTNKAFQNIQVDESEQSTKIPILCDENVLETTDLEESLNNDYTLNETQIDLGSEKISMESTTDEIQNVPVTLISSEEVNDVDSISPTTVEQKQDFHGLDERTQQHTNNFDCFIKLTRCDNLLKNIGALNQKCYVELVRCDDTETFNKANPSPSPHLLEERTLKENDRNNMDLNEDDIGDCKINDELINPLVEDEENKYEPKLERSTSCSILTDFLICKETMDYTTIDKKVINVNKQEGLKSPVYFEDTCYAEWSMTKRDIYLQTAMPMESIHQDPNLFDNSPDYAELSTQVKGNVKTKKSNSVPEILPTFQVQSLSKLALKFFESNTLLDLLYPISHDTANMTENSKPPLKRKLSYQYRSSSKKISKLEHQIPSCGENVVTEQVKNKPCVVTGSKLSTESANDFDEIELANNPSEDKNNFCIDTEEPSSVIESVITPKCDMTFDKDTGLNIVEQIDIECNKYNKDIDLFDDANRLNKTIPIETDICKDDTTKLESLAKSYSYMKDISNTSDTTQGLNEICVSDIDKPKDLCDSFHIIEENDIAITDNSKICNQSKNKKIYINIDHSYAAINKDDSNSFYHVSKTKYCDNEDDISDLTNQDCNVINSTTEVQNITTETVQDLVLGNVENGDVTYEQGAEDKYDVLRNVTLVYQDDAKIVLRGIEYEDPIAGTCYMFPLENNTMFSDVVDEGDYLRDEKDEYTGDDDKMQVKSSTEIDVLSDDSLSIVPPTKTYLRYEKDDKQSLDRLSKSGLKRKYSLDHQMCKKRYRKSKNIDYLKASVDTQKNTAYGKEYKQLLHYYSSIKFSYTRPFDKEQIDVPKLLSAWPIKETHNMPLFDTESSDLFKDNCEQRCYPDPLKQTLVEELSAEVTEYSITSDDTSDTNFNMGFGEESGRVIQNLEKKDDILKFSAATLSDVKQSQPFLMSQEYVGCENSIEVSNLFSSSKKNQNIKLKTDYIQLKDKVRSYFKKTAIELKYNWIRDNLKDKDVMRNINGDNNFTNCLLDFYLYDFIEPPPIESIVQVVQIGQLPVSAAAQNPVSCDPRVTQVANASPPQCSEENSSHDDSHSPVKTEYTELTTADLTLPLVAEYNRHDCHKITESQEPAHLHNNQEILQSEFGYGGKMDTKKDYNHDEVKDLSLKNKEFQTLGKEKPNHSVYHYDTNADNECSELDTPTTFFDPTKKQNTVSERTDQIAHAMSAAGITTTIEDNSKAQALVDNISEDLHQSNVDPTQNHINDCPNTASINAVALQQALAQILPPPLSHTSSAETDSQTSSITPQVLHIVKGKHSEGNQITLVDNVQQSVISTPNAAPVLHIVQNKGAKPNPTNNGPSVQQTNSFGALSLVETGHQNGNQLLHIVNAGNQKDTTANQLLKTVNLLTNLANVQGSNEQKMLQFVCKSTDGKAIQLNTPHHGSMVLRLQPIETQSVQDGPSNNQECSPTPAAASNAPVEENLNTQQEIKSRSVYEENYAKFIQNTSNKSNPEKGTSLPKFNQAFGKPVFQEENQKESEINSNDTHLTSGNSVDDTPETSEMNLDHIAQISSPPLLLRKSPQSSQAPPSLVPQLKQSVTPMNIQTMHGGVIYTRQIPVNIGGGQTINLITVPSTELVDDSNQKHQDVKFVNQGDIVEPSIIKIVPQTTPNSDLSPDENQNAGTLNEGGQNTQSQPVLTQMRIKLPMLSKAPQMVTGTRVVRPSFFQIQRNVIGGANQPVYQQLVLTTAPPLGQQTIRLPQSPMTRPIKVPSESSPESHLSSSTLEQLREFDMVLEQVKERSTVQPSSTANTPISKPHTTTSSDAKDGASPAPTPSEPTPVLYSVGANQQFNVAYVNKKSTVTTPTTSTVVRSPDSSVTESPTSSNHVQVSQTVTTATTSNSTSVQQSNPKPKVSSRSRPRPKASSNPPNTLKLNNVPSKPSTQKPIEDEQTTQRILYILAEYREQVENCPDKNKPAPRRRTNPPSNPGSSKRKKSSSGSRRSGARDSSPINGDDANRTMGSEDSSCGTSQGDCNENCLETPSPQDSPRKLPRKLSFENETPPPQPRPQLQRNVIVADGQTITVARGPTGKPATALLMPANYILPVSMLKGGQQIAIVTNRGPKLLTLSGEGGTTGALLLQRLIGPAGLKPMLARPGVRHVRLPAAALHNLHAFNFTTATTVQPPDSTMSPASATTPPDLVETGTAASPWIEKETQSVKPERSPSPDGSEPWNVPTSANTHEYTYEETVRTDNLDRTVLVVQKRDITSHRQHRLTHVATAALRHKYAILEHELRLQKSLSEECEDLGVDSPSASELFPEAELLFAGSPAQDHTQDQHPHRPHTPPPVIINQSVPRPDMDDQIATDHLLQRPDLQEETNSDLAMNLGLDDVGIVTVTENGATITLDHEEFARSHPNTTFHKEPTEETEMHPYTVTGIKSRHITSTIFHASRAPATVLMGPQTTVISQASHDSPHIQHNVRYSHMDNVINTPASHHHNLNLNTVLVKDDGLTRYDSILTDSRELHLSNTASAIVHSVGNATQVIRRVGYDDDKRDSRFLMDDDTMMTGDDSKMMGEDNSREALESMCGDVDYRSSPERQTELYWESNSVVDHSESRRQMDFSSDSEKCCRSPPYEENNSTDSSGMSTQVRLDSVIKDARGMDRSGSADGSSADDTLPPLRTYPAKRVYHHPVDRDTGRSLSGKTRAGEGLDILDVRRRASGRGVVKRCCHCCSGSPLPPRPKKPKPRKPSLDYHMH
ncbi:PREDICTED: uncharacterized protein LOC106111274 [Papilio polytes]|uniref:uncharacterized protein LOC106111274 n=1 Tax=Papilio polytes TaxID=76194 RepID=UPI000675F0A4|nr:PREDICTED: uncharacterized protein LOC106111274 [Papilio polytes]